MDKNYSFDLENLEAIEAAKASLTWEEADDVVSKLEGVCYRAYRNNNCLSSWGHAMFADDKQTICNNYGREFRDPKWFTVEKSELVDIDDLKEAIIAAFENREEGELDYWDDLDSEEFFAMYDPEDIVNSAEAYDNGELLEWLYESVIEPNDIAGIKTWDGAIVFDASIIRRNVACEVVYS